MGFTINLLTTVTVVFNFDRNRINERPSNPDEQEIPRSLKEMMKSKDRLKMRPKKNRSKENRRRMFGMFAGKMILK